MKAIELLRVGAELLKMMSIFELHRDDYRHIGMYEEYMQRRIAGEKVVPFCLICRRSIVCRKAR